MSEVTDLDASNLCTTEDAFETFQAISMYQEDEYITLSDLVSPEPAAPDLSSEINEIPYDNEVVLTSNAEERVEVSTALNPDIEETIHATVEPSDLTSSEITIENPVDTSNKNCLSSNEKPVNGKRKARKKNMVYGGTSEFSSNFSGNFEENSTPNPNLILDSDKNHRKNVRKSDTFLEDNSAVEDDETPLKYVSRSGRTIKLKTNIDIKPKLDYANKKVSSRRGRPKKITTADIQTSLDTDSTNLSCSLVPNEVSHSENDAFDDVSTPINRVKKRGRPKKILQNNQIDDISLGTLNEGGKKWGKPRKNTGNYEIDDASLATLSDGAKTQGRPKKYSGTDENDDMFLGTLSEVVKRRDGRPKKDSDSGENDEMSLSMMGDRVNRRGRPRKEIISQTTELTNNSLTSSGLNNLEMDDKDDIPLNNLKTKQGRQNRVSSVTSSLTPLEKNSVDNTKEDLMNEGDKEFNNISMTLSNENQIDYTTDLQSNNDILSEIKSSPGKRGKKPKKEFIVDPPQDAEVKAEPNKENNEDKTDDLCLSLLKECETNKANDKTDNISIKVETNTDTANSQSTSLDVGSMDLKCGDITNKRNSKMPKMSDFEYNLDSIVVKNEEPAHDNQDDDCNNLLIEDTSKRPTRRKVKKTLHYDEGSDEDPFANVELSDDDEPKRSRKGRRYHSDDEYIPDDEIDILGLGIAAEESSDSDIGETLNEFIMQRKRRSPKKGIGQGPSKKIKKPIPNITTLTPKTDNPAGGDIEGSLQSSVIKANDDSVESEPLRNWGISNEFENFIAKKIQGTNLQIKKVSSNASTEGSLTPLEIPTINANEQKKTIEMCSQTRPIHTKSIAVQTSVPYDMPMKKNLPLTPEQSEKACEFLNSIVKTTSELGQLMTEKSEDFIKKKINTTHVVDTFKMDYCVKKSFLLFKLAKHNLMQMEEDLSKQYDVFLKSNDLLACREQVKVVKTKPRTAPSATAVASDSDCEIVGESTPGPAPKKRQEKPKFNPKTVFLNKELSIKITKKPTEDKKLNIKGRHTVWINDSVMVKKVKPTQSFLAQDSRNKKPPDNFISAKMVSDFFRNYNRTKIISTCAPFISAEWLHVSRDYVCNYFVVAPSKFAGDTVYQQNNGHYINATTENNNIAVQPNCSCLLPNDNTNKITHPETLLTLCTHALQNHLKMINFDVKEASLDNSNQLTDGKNSKRKPVTLFRLCIGVLNEGEKDTKKVFPSIETPPHVFKIMSLKTLSYRRTIEQFFMNNSSSDSSKRKPQSVVNNTNTGIQKKVHEQHDHTSSIMYANKNKIKSLFAICVEFLRKEQEIETQCINVEDHIITLNTASSLKHIAFVNIRNKLYKNEAKRAKSISEHSIYMHKPASDSILATSGNAQESNVTVEGLTINCINTLTEEAFQNLDEPVLNIQDNSQYLEDDNSIYDEEFDTDYNNIEADQTEGDNWVSQVQMQELRSCFTPNNELPLQENNIYNEELAVCPNIALVKIEPQDETADDMIDPTVIKTEPESNINEMTIIPDSIITKSEILDQPDSARVIERQNSNSYDVDSFELFVSSNKMMRTLENQGDEIYSQSGLRVRRQHEPDYAQEYDAGMSLLIPQTYKPLNIENAKGDLMESSSDDTTSDAKLKGKKKIDKRRGKQKKTEPKSKTKEAVTKTKDKLATDIEVAVLTRRMREKIRQEEKRIESSDSEDDNMSLNLRKEKDKKENTEKLKPSKSTKRSDDEIQCNNVDSTEQVLDNTNKSNTPIEKDKFTGFSAIDQNEISSYQKYMKYVYDKILPNVSDMSENNERAVSVDNNSAFNNERSQSPLIDFTEPAELLECEPTMPIFDDVNVRPRGKKEDKKNLDKNNDKQTLNVVNDKIQYTERHGWKCYPVDGNDPKLYQSAYIPLEKLPEDFVDTYLMYQDITDRDKEDEEVNRLINLNSLNRPNIKDTATRSRHKMRNTDGLPAFTHGSEYNSRAGSPANSDHYTELTPSEDEGANVEDELIRPAPRRQTVDNCLAKNLLMNDNDSDSDSGPKKIKEEITDEPMTSKDYRPGPKSKRKHVEAEGKDSENLMLTADKMMNKELTLLHAPIVLKTEMPETPAKGPSTRYKQKSATKNTSTRDNTKADDSEESEEEKREKWVNTKEKLLKRVQKKEDASIEDAKRAKLVSEFIERRGDAPELQNRNRGRGRRSRKKFLERQKQLGVLSKELFGETSDSIGGTGKRSAAAAYKGRRNIRKVIDKKSLARSTVLANMEEFERKRRLSMKQSRLTELLGCEEGVNVLVINDEVCLEYDFDENRPIVTVHPFFTKVMKAHQYEGVKFMWDACFESLSSIEAGHPGGGCILAHCMGLGKTLQVLALLHTVLTHPRAAMRRVLVCCPLSTVLNWVDEINQWIGPVTDQIKVFELSKLKKTYQRAYQLEDWYNGGGIFIIGYELFRSLTTLDPVLDDIKPAVVNKIRKALLNPGPDIIVCDEGHLLKNDCSVLAVAMSRVVTKRRIVLTGTPMQNNLREYYCMVNFVKPNLLGTYSEYSNRFENPIMNGQHRDSIDQDIKLMKARTHILHKVLEGCLQRQEASVLYPYLPTKHEYTVFIPLTKCQWDLYKHYLNFYANQNKPNVLKDFHILQKIWSHPQVLHFFQTKKRDDTRNKVKVEKLEDDLAHEDLVSEDIKPSDTEVWWLQHLDGGKMLEMLNSSNKFVAIFRILDECIELGDKVLIFSTSLFCLDALEYFLKKINKWRLGQEYYRLDGSVPAEVRQKWCREFNAEHNHKTKLFLISTRAGCLGLNMTAANRVIILDTSWNPAHDIQSIFRVYRFGQKKDCFIYRLVALGTMEQKIYERSVTKQAVACRVVDEQQIDRHYNMAELTELYRFDEAGAGVAGGVAVGVQDVVLLRVARDAALHAVHEHDSLLRGSTEQGLPEHERAAAWMQFQQEHAHKQMQNDIDANKEKHLKLLHENALKQSFSQDAIVVKLQGEQKPVLTEPGPSVSDPKAKKGRKSNVVKCFIPIKTEIDQSQPGPSNVQDAGQEDDMVKQITHILIKHNFQNRKGPAEISSLVNSVRKIVQSGHTSRLDMSDELTASIAKVLLQKEGKSMPALTDIMSEPTVTAGPSINTYIAMRKRSLRPRKFIEENDIPVETAVIPDEDCATEIDGRKKRKAALVAEKHLDSLAKDSVIELDDDDWIADSDTDLASQPEDNDEITKTQSSKNDNTLPQVKKDSAQPLSKNYEAAQSKNCATPNDSIVENDSILLSDDDELTLKTTEKSPAVGKLKIKKLSTVEKPTIEKAQRPGPASKKLIITHKEPDKPESDNAIPLHRSLLSNKNFIKIVAHTYLSGNPMLDEDAATLAAQYSTFKALKEVESSGKEIHTGPIYDIAVRVLGIDILKKLHKSNIQTKTSAQEKCTTEQLQDKMLECEQAKLELSNRFEAQAKDKPVESAKPKVGVINIATMRPSPVRRIPPIVQPSVPDVVPVGFFKRATSMSTSETIQQQSGGESILPDDDDDVRIVSDPTPALPANIVPVRPIRVSRRDIKQPILINRNFTTGGEVITVGDKFTPVVTTSPVPARHIEISSGRVMMAQAPIKVTAGPTGRAPPSAASTICLDSDDEEAIVPHATAATAAHPVPVAMTTAGLLPQLVPISLTAASTLSPTLLNSIPNVATPLPVPNNNILYLTPPQKSLLPAQVNPLNQQQVKIAPSPLNTILHRKLQDNVIKVPVPSTPTPENILPTEAPRRLVPGKTVCKPGDILRVTKTGQIELLTKCDDSIAPLATVPTVQTSETAPTAVNPPAKPTEDAKVVQEEPAQTVTDNVSQARTTRKRIRVLSSSSSSSDSSRPSSPDDPLSILKDVVHIQASYQPKTKSRVIAKKPEEVKAPEKPQKKLVAAPTTIKLSTPSTAKSSTPTTAKWSTSSTAKTTVRQNTITTNTKDVNAKTSNRSIISMTDGSSKPTSTLNTSGGKQNASSLLKVRASQQQTATADIVNRVNRSLSSGSKTVRVDMTNRAPSRTIDLTDNVAPKQNTPIKQNTSAVTNKSTPAKSKTLLVKMTEKKSTTTVVGTSKNLILDGKSITTAKKLPSTVDLTGQKSIQITNMKSIQASTSNKSIGDKKRPSTVDAIALKKKKTEQMTLKDFNIDDIDDIIELE